MKRILTLFVIIAMLLTMTTVAHADGAVESLVTVDSEEVSSEGVTETTSSAAVSEDSSETVSLGISSKSNSSDGAELDFALTMIVFVIATAAIVGIIVFSTKKK